LTQGGAPIRTFEKDDEGWAEAWSYFQQLDSHRTPAGPTGAATGTALPTNGLAIASLVLGIVWLWGIGSILAIIFGVVAKNQIEQSGGRQQGQGLATAGIVLGVVTLGIFVIALIAISASSTSYGF
jgi:hypothetical protein